MGNNPRVSREKFKEIFMKKAQVILVLGVLITLLIGCANPATAIPEEGGIAAAVDEYAPYTLTVYLGKGSDRSIAGPGAGRINSNNIRNFIQAVLLDDDKNIVDVYEFRKPNATNGGGAIQLENVEYGTAGAPKKYHLLVLQGHWQRNYYAESQGGTAGDYMYYADKAPTLLHVGYTPDIAVTDNATPVTIIMYPIWVDAKFTTGNSTAASIGLASLEPKKTPGTLNSGYQRAEQPGITALLPVAWTVEWTVNRYASNAAGASVVSGFTDLLAAQNKAAGTNVTTLAGAPTAKRIDNPTSIILSGPPSYTEITDDTISVGSGTIPKFVQTIPATETEGKSKVGYLGAVNFNYEYVPFNKTTAAAWTGKVAAATGKSSVYFDETTFAGVPKWIIRNGVNDLPQDAKTDFTLKANDAQGKGTHIEWDGDTSSATANGNGALSFEIKYVEPDSSGTDSDFPEYTAPTELRLKIDKVLYKGPAGTAPVIEVTSSGYTDNAALYYKIVTKGASAPHIDTYTLKGDFAVGTRDVTLANSSYNGAIYDIYVVLMKDLHTSKPYKVTTDTGIIKGPSYGW
jgi:hypothetical protein